MLRELIADNASVHGWHWCATYYRKRGMCFTLFYWYAFGRAPRSLNHTFIWSHK